MGTSPNGKTKRWEVKNLGDTRLGGIHWKSVWRKYVYFTTAAMDEFDSACLTEITNFLQAETAKHKEGLK